ncbi:Zn2/Cys6 DNA-binding protein [Glarea lozoyensis ATCC 20868]|uniref:Zn2/Cys6 DNA-binding protein n=1 Tax=Glarea lozoyensis (strain ATCC 20868 / MF5171) TaxID=1116229 RepID=S3D648_GLAL2|nr:Zn2/Cys6 DNA-binding protein [Glarea lozoyensis ATCC 20868]EPE33942.1 Zn2/Cys6 DNA-binding protein [Glarea lozoyensis ATCC 20868]
MNQDETQFPEQPSKRLPKVRQACDCCHARKIRCDGQNPCSNCQMTILACTYLAVPKKKGPKGKRVFRDGAKEGKRVKKLRMGQGNSKVHTSPPNHQTNRTRMPSESTEGIITEENGFKPSALITDAVITSCVDAFFTHKYPIMPILEHESVNAALPNIRQSPERYALITSLCAGIVQQPEIIASPIATAYGSQEIPLLELPASEHFIQETVRARQYCNYIDSPTLETVQTSFFLFAALFCLGKDNSAWFYIREAMTVLQLLRLHEEDTYQNLAEPYATYSRRTFWLLFITERAYALQRHRPLTLQRTISLPTVSPGPESIILSGFLDLVSLFQNFDDEFLSLWNLSTTVGASSGSSASPQSLIQLQDILKFAIPNVSQRTEVQQADLLISRQWLKTMVWQLCVTKGLLSSAPSNEAMSFQYPVTIARDVVFVSRNLSPKALEANGVGILEKIFDIGCSLADVLQLQPNHMYASAMEIGPRDYLMEMVRLLSIGRNSLGVQGAAGGINGGEKFLRLLARKAEDCLNPRISRGSLSDSDESRCIEEIDDDENLENGIEDAINKTERPGYYSAPPPPWSSSKKIVRRNDVWST